MPLFLAIVANKVIAFAIKPTARRFCMDGCQMLVKSS
jgi:hypothetical protein